MSSVPPGPSPPGRPSLKQTPKTDKTCRPPPNWNTTTGVANPNITSQTFDPIATPLTTAAIGAARCISGVSSSFSQRQGSYRFRIADSGVAGVVWTTPFAWTIFSMSASSDGRKSVKFSKPVPVTTPTSS